MEDTRSSDSTDVVARDSIEGLRYIPDYLSPDEEESILQRLACLEWNNPLPRRTHHFGFMYDFTSGISDPRLGPTEPLPTWLQGLATRLHEEGLMPHLPDQVIVNEYQPGQGLGFHIDRTDSFDNCVVSLSLQSGCAMDFKHKDTKQKVQLYLERRSALVLTGEARYVWLHSVGRRTEDLVNGEVIPRGCRLSLTFRRVLDQAKPMHQSTVKERETSG